MDPRLTYELPHRGVAELPADVRDAFAALVSAGASPPGYAVLKPARTPTQLKHDAMIATTWSAALLIGGFGVGIWLAVRVAPVTGLIVGVLAVFLAALSSFLWSANRRQLARDPRWCCGLASRQHLVMRDGGTVRVLPLGWITHVQAEVRTINGAVGSVAIVLVGARTDWRWIGLDAFGPEAVAGFAARVNGLIAPELEQRKAA